MVKNKLNKLIITAMLIAIEIVLSRFLSFSTQTLRIGFSFLPVVICAAALGIEYTACLGVISDIIGALLFPSGAYFPGFTLTAAITAVIFGLFLYKKITVCNIIISVLLTQIFCSLLLNTYWLTILYGSEFIPLLISRSIQTLIMIAIEIITLIVLMQPIKKLTEFINK